MDHLWIFINHVTNEEVLNIVKRGDEYSILAYGYMGWFIHSYSYNFCIMGRLGRETIIYAITYMNMLIWSPPLGPDGWIKEYILCTYLPYCHCASLIMSPYKHFL